MFAKHNDPNLLRFATLVFLLGVVAAALGIARFAVATTITGALEADMAALVVFGYFGWCFAFMYAFAQPGWRRLLPVMVPGLVLAPVAYFALLRSMYPQVDQNLLAFGTLGFALGYPALGRMLWDRYIGGAADAYRRKLDGMLFTSVGILLLAYTPGAYLDIATSLIPPHTTTYHSN